MKYDFETVIDRRGTNSSKWDVEEGKLPLTTADMDFRCAPEIINSLKKRIDQGVFGYTQVDDLWYKAYKDFYLKNYDLYIKKEDLIFSTGVVPTISSAVRAMSKVGDKIVVLSPVYNIFYNSIINNKREVLEVPLIKEGDTYLIDFDSLRSAFEDENVSMMILCNPANPISRIWTKQELAKIGRLARKNDVFVLSDEIHGPITAPGKKYIPYFQASYDNEEYAMTAISPTKAFNLAGIQTSAMIISDQSVRKKVVRQLNTDECAEPNVLALEAVKAAYNESSAWLDEARKVIFKNRKHVISYIQENIDSLHVIDGDATYLLWIDISKTGLNSKEFVFKLEEETGLILSAGYIYGKGGEGFVRMNVAYPISIIDDALNRLKTFVDKIKG